MGPWGARSGAPTLLLRRILPSPWGLTVKNAGDGGSVDTETEGGHRFAIIAPVVRHSPLQEQAMRDWLGDNGILVVLGPLQVLVHGGVRGDVGLLGTSTSQHPWGNPGALLPPRS